ncbi:amidase [Corynebacterium sp. Q4381]|uniref:amidase n=1 Tax=Corynebacterium sp. Marseille-Q4381 TaxID=3121597 RepID=UPI002FE65640
MHHPAFSFFADEPLRGAPGGRLDGWWIPVKDSTNVRGWPTTDGSPHRARTARTTDPIAQKLLAAGATIPAKTLTSELGATCYAERPDVPVLESPAYPGRTPGGSSTGAGVAVSLGLCRAAHGTDAGGSIRVPAAACEVIGFKFGGASLAADGFLARSTAELRTVLGWPPQLEVPRRLRIGLLTDGLFTPTTLQPERGDAVTACASTLAKRHDVVDISRYPQACATYEHFTSLITSSFRKLDPLDSEYIAWMKETGSGVTAAQLADAVAHRAELPGILAAAWDVDVVLSPTLAYDPPAIGYFPSLPPEESFHAQTEWSPWCSLFNMLQAPALALGPVHLGAVTATGRELLALADELRPA